MLTTALTWIQIDSTATSIRWRLRAPNDLERYQDAVAEVAAAVREHLGVADMVAAWDADADVEGWRHVDLPTPEPDRLCVGEGI